MASRLEYRGVAAGYRSPAHRSIELADWAPLLGRDDVIPLIFSMAIRDELAALHIETDVTVHDINVDLKNDLEGLSALLANLDLVIGRHHHGSSRRCAGR